MRPTRRAWTQQSRVTKQSAVAASAASFQARRGRPRMVLDRRLLRTCWRFPATSRTPFELDRALRIYRRAVAAYEQCGHISEA